MSIERNDVIREYRRLWYKYHTAVKYHHVRTKWYGLWIVIGKLSSLICLFSSVILTISVSKDSLLNIDTTVTISVLIVIILASIFVAIILFIDFPKLQATERLLQDKYNSYISKMPSDVRLIQKENDQKKLIEIYELLTNINSKSYLDSTPETDNYEYLKKICYNKIVAKEYRRYKGEKGKYFLPIPWYGHLVKNFVKG